MKRSKVIAQQPKTLENPSITDIKWTKWIDDIKFPVKVRDFHKIEKKKRILSSLVFLMMKIKNNIQIMCQKILSKDMLLYYW